MIGAGFCGVEIRVADVLSQDPALTAQSYVVLEYTVRQLDGIAVERTFTDKASGKDTTRPALDEMLAFVRDGDTVIVHSMDRLARNLDDLRRVVRSLTGKGVRVEFAKESLAFTATTHRWQPCCCRSWEPSPSSSAP